MEEREQSSQSHLIRKPRPNKTTQYNLWTNKTNNLAAFLSEIIVSVSLRCCRRPTHWKNQMRRISLRVSRYAIYEAITLLLSHQLPSPNPSFRVNHMFIAIPNVFLRPDPENQSRRYEQVRKSGRERKGVATAYKTGF